MIELGEMLGTLPDASFGNFVYVPPSTELGGNFGLLLGKILSFLKMTSLGTKLGKLLVA